LFIRISLTCTSFGNIKLKKAGRKDKLKKDFFCTV